MVFQVQTMDEEIARTALDQGSGMHQDQGGSLLLRDVTATATKRTATATGVVTDEVTLTAMKPVETKKIILVAREMITSVVIGMTTPIVIVMNMPQETVVTDTTMYVNKEILTVILMMIPGDGEMMADEMSGWRPGVSETGTGMKTVNDQQQMIVTVVPNALQGVTGETVVKRAKIEKKGGSENGSGIEKHNQRGWKPTFQQRLVVASLVEAPVMANWMVFRLGRKA